MMDGELAGAMVVIDTGMGSFIPEHILVYVAVDAAQRGHGIGTQLMNAMRETCHGDVALHVEYDNRHGACTNVLALRQSMPRCGSIDSYSSSVPPLSWPDYAFTP